MVPCCPASVLHPVGLRRFNPRRQIDEQSGGDSSQSHPRWWLGTPGSGACGALGAAPHETLYVGDDLLLDVQGAQQAGLRGAWMNRHGQEKTDERHQHIEPDAEFKNLHDLTKWL